jgi:periplasmic protein TonB
VGYLVDPAGKVISAYVVRSTRPEFESEAVGAVSQWRFKPGKKGGVSVTARMQTPIVFTLMNES